jgi:hypothetical protein
LRKAAASVILPPATDIMIPFEKQKKINDTNDGSRSTARI